jgi:hypothetical protein
MRPVRAKELSNSGRADERTRTDDLISLRVIIQVLLRLARGCRSRISREVSLLWLAWCCIILRSRWCQSGVRSPWVTRRRSLFESRSRTSVFATRCNDRPQYPIGRTVATGPQDRRCTQEAKQSSQTSLPRTRVNRGPTEKKGPRVLHFVRAE